MEAWRVSARGLAVHLERDEQGRSVVRLVLPPGSSEAELLVNGALQAEFGLGVAEGPEDLRAEVRAARAARAGISFLARVLKDWDQATDSPDGQGSSAKARREAFAEGLLRGLMRDPGRPHPQLPHDQTHNLPPEWPLGKGKRAHTEGWELGRAIMRAVDIAKEAP